MKRQLAEHGYCFVCGKENPHGIGLTWFADENHIIYASFNLTEAQQGPPGYAHGGASAAILDEALGAAIWNAGYNVAVVRLEMTYHLPLPLHTPLRLEARMTRRYRRRRFATGEIYLPDGRVAVRARGIYVEAPQLFEARRYRDYVEETGEKEEGED
jgi:acyl-coenzyme A thioesterase PaaI-like protein